MSIIRPNWDAPKNIHALSTTRSSLDTSISGVEPGVYDYCNLGAHVDDDLDSVMANRRALVTEYEIPNSPAWLEQTHSIEVAILTSAIFADGSPVKADGSITREQNTVCTVMTADCLPLLLCDVQGTQVAAIHAGWRGMSDGIIENAVSMFDCAPEQIIAWAGPCIGPSKFEIGLEVQLQLGGLSSHYRASDKDNDKVLADLYAICGFKLAELGVINYKHSSACTYSDKSQFYSYRRDGQCGRMASLIWIGEPS